MVLHSSLGAGPCARERQDARVLTQGLYRCDC